MPIEFQNDKGIELFAIIVDINGFTNIVTLSEGNLIAQFTRDVLSSCIAAVEGEQGEVVGFMGDAFLGVLSEPDQVFKCCVRIAKEVDKMCGYISKNSGAFSFAPSGPSLKIGVEYGCIDISDISSRLLGQHKILIGNAINYAARITNAGEGNRCLIGPKAYEKGLIDYIRTEDGPFEVEGKIGEPIYTYYKLDLGDIWIEGVGKDSFWD